MRKMNKVLGTPAREMLNKLSRKDTSKAARIERKVNGKCTKFSVYYQQSPGVPQKVIDVTDGVGFGSALSWADALKLAREFASMRPAQ